jgi:Uma2 family endonuclease
MASVKRLRLRASSAGVLLTPEEFDAAEFKQGPRYELINGVLVVSPNPMRQERASNDYLGHLVREYQEEHALGPIVDVTLPEETIHSTPNRRRADRVIWAGLGRLPNDDDPPTILIEFVSKGRAAHTRDHLVKRAEYATIGTREYVVFDRFQRTVTVIDYTTPGAAPCILGEKDVYRTPILPGFEVSIARLFALADRWDRKKTT